MSLPSKVDKTKNNNTSIIPSDKVRNDFYEFTTELSKQTGKDRNEIIYDLFSENGGFLTVEEACSIEESANAGSSQPIMTAYSVPKVLDDVDELRRLRREFAPVSKAVDYILSMILGSRIEIIIDDPEDSNQIDSKKRIQQFTNTIYQDVVTQSLYTLMRIMLNKSLTDGVCAAEIRYDRPIKFMDYVDGIDTVNSNKYIVYRTREPDWKELNGIVQLKIFDNTIKRLKVYKNPLTWDFNYLTLDEIVNDGENQNDLKDLNKAKEQSGQTIKYHPWQVFWLAVNRDDKNETGMSVITPVKKIALILEKVLQACGESAYRNANKKYALVMGDDKHTIGKTQQRNVLQLFNEMGKRGWSAIPVPAGFDYKEFGGTAFDASNVINTLLIMIAEGMHVPIDVLGVGKAGTETSKAQTTTTFNEIEQMRYEFKQAIINQLFKRELYCEMGKTRTKQGGKGVAPIYVPDILISTKGLLSPIDELEAYKSFLNAANPLTPQVKYEMERRIAKIFGFEIKFMDTEEYAEKVKKEEEMAQKMKDFEMKSAEIGVKQAQYNLDHPAPKQPAGFGGKKPASGAKSAKKPFSASTDKRQGQPQAPSRDKQLKRLKNGVSNAKPTKAPSVNPPKNRGSTRKPKTVNESFIWETWNRELEDAEHRQRRVQMIIEAQANNQLLTHEDIDKLFIEEQKVEPIEDEDVYDDEPYNEELSEDEEYDEIEEELDEE